LTFSPEHLRLGKRLREPLARSRHKFQLEKTICGSPKGEEATESSSSGDQDIGRSCFASIQRGLQRLCNQALAPGSVPSIGKTSGFRTAESEPVGLGCPS